MAQALGGVMHLSRRALAMAALSAVWGCAEAVDGDRIVASFSVLADLTRQILGEAGSAGVLVGPDADAHVFEPSPADAIAVSQAALFVENGLGFEPWLDRLKSASEFTGASCVASEGVEPLRIGQTIDPHAWQDVSNARRYAQNIARAVADIAPLAADAIAARATGLDQRLAMLDSDIRSLLAAVPAPRRVVVTSHDAFGYFGRAYDVRFLAPLGLATDAEPRPADIAALIDQIRREGVRALFVENMADPRLLETISAETGVHIGGRLYSDALSGPDGPAATYEAMMRHNTARIASALA
jgi:zinc/manganese transport system substrate-binding protein